MNVLCDDADDKGEELYTADQNRNAAVCELPELTPAAERSSVDNSSTKRWPSKS